MTLSKTQHYTRVYSQLAGLLYLIIALVGGFSIGYMPKIIVADANATLTFQNLLENQELFRWGIIGDIIVLVLEIVLTVILFRLFKAYSSVGIYIATYSRIAMAIIMGFNLINYLIPEVIAAQPEYLNSFSPEQLESLTLLFFNAHHYGVMAWQIFFSIHLFTLGYVLYKSQKPPKVLSVLMLIGGLGYGGDCFRQLTFINSEMVALFFSALLVLAVVGELWFAFWLLLKAGKESFKEMKRT